MKKSFSLLELILSLTLIAFLYTVFTSKNKLDTQKQITDKLSLYINHLRHKALIDNKYDLEDELWHKKRWTIKFFRCQKEVGGIYYVIYSDNNKSGHPRIEDSLKDPLTNKNIYSSNSCKKNQKNSSYVLLTKEFGIDDVNISCNQTTSLGQLSFGSDGKIYSKLSSFKNESKEYEIKQACTIKLMSKNEQKSQITLYPYTGYNKVEY